MKYSVRLTQGILDGNLFAGSLSFRSPATALKSSWGVYNPLNSGAQALIYSLEIVVARTQPVTDSGHTGASRYMIYVHNSAQSPVVAPTVTSVFAQDILGMNRTSPLVQLNDNNYTTPGAISSQALGLSFDPQAGSTFRLENYVSIRSTFPIILYPGDFLGGQAGVDFFNAAPVTYGQLRFVQLPV